jgi:hypothetical protein
LVVQAAQAVKVAVRKVQLLLVAVEEMREVANVVVSAVVVVAIAEVVVTALVVKIVNKVAVTVQVEIAQVVQERDNQSRDRHRLDIKA